MSDRREILIGMGLGLVWAILLVWIGTAFVNVPVFSRQFVTPFYFLAPGLVLLAMIARLAQRRMFDDTILDGGEAAPGSGADIDRRVLQNTIEQAVLAICLWPAISFIVLEDGPGIVLTLSIGFAIARVAFWIGYHISPPLRAFGFAATFYPTIVALIWSALWWATT